MKIYQNADEELRGGDEQDWNLHGRTFAVLLVDHAPTFDHRHTSMDAVRKAQDPKLPEDTDEAAVRAHSHHVSGDGSQRMVLFFADGTTAAESISEHRGPGILFERRNEGKKRQEIPIAILEGGDLRVLSNGEGLRFTFSAMPLSANMA